MLREEEHTMNTPPGLSLELLPENLFREPIDRLYADHFQLRRICDQLDQLASERCAEQIPDVANAVMTYLEHDLPLHIADEEDLLPLLRTRCDPGDEIDV